MPIFEDEINNEEFFEEQKRLNDKILRLSCREIIEELNENHRDKRYPLPPSEAPNS